MFLQMTTECDPKDILGEDPGPASKRPGFLGNSITRVFFFFHTIHKEYIWTLISDFYRLVVSIYR